ARIGGGWRLALLLGRHVRAAEERRDVPAIAAVRLAVGLVDRRPVARRPEAASEPPKPCPHRSHGHMLCPARCRRHPAIDRKGTWVEAAHGERCCAWQAAQTGRPSVVRAERTTAQL